MKTIIEIIVMVIICVQMVVSTNRSQNRPKEQSVKVQHSKRQLVMAIMQFFILIISGFTILSNYFGIGYINFPLILNFIGVFTMLIGLLIRIISMRALGKYYSTILFVEKEQPLLTTGIYNRVRHPIYLGDLLLYLTIGLALGNILDLLIIAIIVIPIYINRIQFEEKMMMEKFGNLYEGYKRNTKRVIPFII